MISCLQLAPDPAKKREGMRVSSQKSRNFVAGLPLRTSDAAPRHAFLQWSAACGSSFLAFGDDWWLVKCWVDATR